MNQSIITPGILSDSKECLALYFQQNFSARGTQVRIFETNKLKIGKNLPVNRLKLINGLIKYEWLHLGFESYKINCKKYILVLWESKHLCGLSNENFNSLT